MNNSVDVFWSFRSPFSYLVTPDLIRLRDDFDVSVQLRPVLPLALRAKNTVFDVNDKKRPKYFLLDASRRAEFLGLPYVWPNPDPVAQDYETFELAENQERIWRLTTLGVEAQKHGKGIDFAREVAGLIWGGTADWDQGDHLAKAVAKAGQDLATLEDKLDVESAKASIELNHEALEAAGHWGVPTMVFEGEPFFGQDRIDTLRWRLDQSGLRRS